uniref:translationally-controlled tumor protein homolog n=1 Tax=Erigeron canadensis TaxID=72917 RepID=UPI001CB9D67E|nr:translationally-controlled tumor protein homolog [Erigeron canadensis]
MYLYNDQETGDTLFSNAFFKMEIFGDVLFEAQGNIVKAVEVDISSRLPTLEMRKDHVKKATTSTQREAQRVWTLLKRSGYKLDFRDFGAYLEKYSKKTVKALAGDKEAFIQNFMSEAAKYLLNFYDSFRL